MALAVGLFLGVFVVILGFLCKGRKAAIAELLAGDVSEEGLESAVESRVDKAGEKGKSPAFSIRVLHARVRAKIYMSLIQVLSSIGTVFEIAFPPVFSGMMKWVGILQLDIFSALPLDCVMTSSFHTTLIMRTLIPLGIMGGLGAWGAWLLRKGDTSTAKGASRVWLGNVLFNLVFVILFFIYPSTSAKIFATFQCKDIGDGTRYLRSDLSIDCDSSAHVGMQVYAGLMVLIYPLGAPALYALLLFRNYGDQLWRMRDIEIARDLIAQEAVSADQLGKWDSATGKAGKASSERSTSVQPRVEKLELDEKALKAKLPGYVQTLSGSGYSLRVVSSHPAQHLPDLGAPALASLPARSLGLSLLRHLRPPLELCALAVLLRDRRVAAQALDRLRPRLLHLGLDRPAALWPDDLFRHLWDLLECSPVRQRRRQPLCHHGASAHLLLARLLDRPLDRDAGRRHRHGR